MRVDFNQNLIGMNGQVLMFDEDKPAVLREPCVNALMAKLDDDRGLTGEQKMTIWLLAKRIHTSNGHLDLTVEEVAEVKGRVGKAFPANVVGPVFTALEGASSDG